MLPELDELTTGWLNRFGNLVDGINGDDGALISWAG